MTEVKEAASEKMTLPVYTDEELEKLAQDLFAGRIFTDRHLSHRDDITLVFMPLIFLTQEQLKEMVDLNIQLIFEYIDKAGPRSVNGYPSFFSFKAMGAEDTVKLLKRYEEIKTFMDSRAKSAG